VLQTSEIENPNNPSIAIDSLEFAGKELLVVRDDILAGGTKQRAAIPYLLDLVKDGYDEFVYASPFSGFAQVALAYSAQTVGVDCTLFCERDPSTLSEHAFTKLAVDAGARVGLSETLEQCETLAKRYVSMRDSSFKIPLGFDDVRFRNHLSEALSVQWKNLCSDLGRTPDSLWISLGSGTLTRVLHEVLPNSVNIHCVDVHVLKKDDARIQSACRPTRVHYHSAPEIFHEVAKSPPPLPSNAFYDAKVWQFIRENSEDGAIWWNVAR
jgi:hypothetical protein